MCACVCVFVLRDRGGGGGEGIRAVGLLTRFGNRVMYCYYAGCVNQKDDVQWDKCAISFSLTW